MNELDAFRAFLAREREASEAESRVAQLMTSEALVDRGEAIAGLTICQRAKNRLVLEAMENESRLRPGSRVRIEGPGVAPIPASIRAIEKAGLAIEVFVDRKVQDLPDGPYLIREAPIDLSAIYFECLKKFQAGAPGWTFFRTLTKQTQQIPTILPEKDREHAMQVLAEVTGSLTHPLDASQSAVVKRCVTQPLVFGVQGPPGTGKTRVLAVVAETLCRLGKRVLVIAPTHQAVNNALSTIHETFPSRPVTKVGDGMHRESLSKDIPCLVLDDFGKSKPPALLRETITGMTLVSALCQFALKTSGLAPNVILIDEAGQVPFVQGICTGLIGAGSVLMFGDDAQMPPVFASEVEDDPLAVSLFRQLRDAQLDAVEMLDITYRLNAPICELISQAFYSQGASTLQSSPEAAGRRLLVQIANPNLAPAVAKALNPDESVVWVQSPDTQSRQVNRVEASFVADVVIAALNGGLEVSDIAVVTPYRRQAALIRRMIQSHLPPSAPIPIVDTVERVQGLTVKLAIVSFCTSDPEHGAALANFLFSPNRLNVAISRATCKVIVLASAQLFAGVPLVYQHLRRQQLVKETLGKMMSVAFDGDEWRTDDSAVL